MSASSLPWDVTAPFIIDVIACSDDLDGFNHVNNRVYIRWQEEVSWAHSQALGLTIEDYTKIGTGVIVHRNDVIYLAPVLAGDKLRAATWISANDGRLRMQRRHQIIRVADKKTVFRGTTNYVSIDMTTGKPRRMPPLFRQIYAPIDGLSCSE